MQRHSDPRIKSVVYVWPPTFLLGSQDRWQLNLSAPSAIWIKHCSFGCTSSSASSFQWSKNLKHRSLIAFFNLIFLQEKLISSFYCRISKSLQNYNQNYKTVIYFKSSNITIKLHFFSSYIWLISKKLTWALFCSRNLRSRDWAPLLKQSSFPGDFFQSSKQ